MIETERLCLRKITPDDLTALHRIYSDSECMQFYPSTKSFEETRAWFQQLAFDSYRRYDFGLWAIAHKQTGDVIGDCGITMQNTPLGREPELGYHLWRDYWKLGIATEAALACRNYAFDKLGLSRIVSITSPENLPSQMVASRVHDRKEIYIKQIARTGQNVERYLYISEI
ncbi:GNAT family N-acetyltransferase [Brucellaceae bacterium C25G]